MKRLLPLLIVVITLFGCQENGPGKQDASNQYVIGHSDSIYSDILKEQRKVWVYLPNSFTNDDPQLKYPVIYLFDGAGFFHSSTGIIKDLTRAEVMPQAVVVAIQNPHRDKDLTPTHMATDYWSGESTPNTGGGEKFLDFVEQELIPFAESKYNLTDYRTIIGHSLGGLTVVHTLFTRPHLFDNYVALEPSLWWDDGYLLKALDTAFNKVGPDLSSKSLFVGIANTMRHGFNMDNLFSDTTKSTVHLRTLFEFVHRIDEKRESRLKTGWKFYEDDDHTSMTLLSTYDALTHLKQLRGMLKSQTSGYQHIKI